MSRVSKANSALFRYRNAQTRRFRKYAPSWGPSRHTRRWPNRWSPCCYTTDGTNSRSWANAPGSRSPKRWKKNRLSTISPWTTSRPSTIGTHAARRGWIAAKSAYGSELYRTPKIGPAVSPHFFTFALAHKIQLSVFRQRRESQLRISHSNDSGDRLLRSSINFISLISS